MISKETFCKALLMIKEQSEINSKVGDALELVCDGHVIFGAFDKCRDALLMVLKESVNDRYDYISWCQQWHTSQSREQFHQTLPDIQRELLRQLVWHRLLLLHQHPYLFRQYCFLAHQKATQPPQ